MPEIKRFTDIKIDDTPLIEYLHKYEIEDLITNTKIKLGELKIFHSLFSRATDYYDKFGDLKFVGTMWDQIRIYHLHHEEKIVDADIGNNEDEQGKNGCKKIKFPCKEISKLAKMIDQAISKT